MDPDWDGIMKGRAREPKTPKVTPQVFRVGQAWFDRPAVLAIAARAVTLHLLREHGRLSESDEKYVQSLAAEALKERT